MKTHGKLIYFRGDYCQFWLARINLQQCPAVEHVSLLNGAKNGGTFLFVHPPLQTALLR